MDKHTSEQNNLVTYWRNKLDWYMQEATDEEEILAIKSILDIMESEKLDESYYNPEKGFERFKETLDIRMKIQDEMQRSKDKADARKRFASKTKGFRKVAMVASLVVMLFIGGVAGAYAQREGFLGTIVNNEEKDFLVSSPNFNNKQMEYDNIKNVPLKYISCLWTPANIPEDMELKTITITERSTNIKTRCEYKKETEKKFITVSKDNFINGTIVSDKLHDGFKEYKIKNYDSVEIQYMVKNNSDYTEYIATFAYDGCLFSIKSNLEFEVISNILKSCFDTNSF